MKSLARSIFALSLSALLAVPLSAQDADVVFLHGLNGNASQWADTAERLRQSIALTPHAPALDWTQPLSTQALSLQARPDYSTLPDSTVVVGHSNGGLVAREWTELRSLGGIVTIGTPHGGAPLVPHFLAWANFIGTAPTVLNQLFTAFSTVTDWSWIFGFVANGLHFVSDFSLWSVIYLAVTIGAQTAAPVFGDMVPGSPFLLHRNSSSALAHEASAAPNRVGIVSVAHNFYYAGPARAIDPDDADALALTMYSTAFGLIYWAGYIQVHADPSDIPSMNQAMALLDTAGYLLSIDPFYCRMVSRIDASLCIPSDGVVPIDSQTFPNAPNIQIGLDNDGPAHIQERDHSDDALYQALVWFMHVPPRGSVPPPPAPPPPPPPPPSDPGSSPDAVVHYEPSDGPVGSERHDTLQSGDTLLGSGSVGSPDGRFHLDYQTDGNLVLYDASGAPLWASQTAGQSTGRVVMQSDGNLVIYDASGQPVWASRTDGQSGAFLLVQDDGNVVIYDSGGTVPLWATNTGR